MSQLIDAIAQRFKQSKTTAAGAYKKLVTQVADGKANPDIAQEIMREAGKSPDDLAADVAMLERRREARGKVIRSNKLEDQREEINQAITAADQALEAAVNRHAETVGPLRDSLAEVDEANAEAGRAREFLLAGGDPELVRRARELESEISQKRELFNRHFVSQRRLDDEIKSDTADLTQFSAPGRMNSVVRDGVDGTDETRRRLARNNESLAAARVEMPKLQKEIERLTVELSAVHDKLIGS